MSTLLSPPEARPVAPPPAEVPPGGALRRKWLRVRALLRKELRQLFRDPKTKRIVFASPVLQLLLFGYAVNTDVHDVPVHLVDLDRTQASRELRDALGAGGYFRVVA